MVDPDKQAAPRSLPANLHPPTRFDYRQADLTWAEGRWLLRANGMPLKDFGRREAEAREALRIIREFRLNEHGTIGTPQPVMEYWLSDGQAPRGSDLRLRPVSFDPDALRVQEAEGQWQLLAGRQPLFNFGSHRDDAEQALEVLHRHGFNQVGFVGQPVPAMIYFLCDPTRPASSHPPAPQPSHSVVLTNSSRTSPPAKDSTSLAAALTAGRQLATPNALVAAQPSLGDRVPFDWRQVRVRQDGADWKLIYGSYVLGNFGRNEREARQAEAAVHFYRFTEHCCIGRSPGFGYFLANGQAPCGLWIGARTTSFQPNLLAVQSLRASFVLAEGSKVLFDFGSRREEAEQALKIIKQYQFDRLCRIGQGDPAPLTYLVRSR